MPCEVDLSFEVTSNALSRQPNNLKFKVQAKVQQEVERLSTFDKNDWRDQLKWSHLPRREPEAGLAFVRALNFRPTRSRSLLDL